MFGITITAIAGVAAYFILLSLSMELEHLFTENGLSVDHILGGAKREKIFDCEKDDVQIVAPADLFVLKDYEKQGMKVKDFSLGRREAKAYALIYQRRSDHFKMLIEPNERMMGVIRRTFPRKLVM